MVPNFELLTTLATLQHRVHCHASHEDVCGWYHETNLANPWTGMRHTQWLLNAQATAIRNELTLEQVNHVASQYGKAMQAISDWSK